MMGFEELYYPLLGTVFQSGTDSFLVYSRAMPDRILEIDGLCANVFRSCSGARTLEEHGAACLVAGISADPQTIATSLVNLVQLGLLCAGSDLRRVSHPQTPANSLSVAIVTADRPSMLNRCLDSLIAHCHRASRSPNIVVVDGSQSRSLETEAVVKACATSYNDIVYVGAVQARWLCARLLERGLSRDAVVDSLSPGSAGNNRNLALIWAGTDQVIMIDDDVLCEPWASRNEEAGIIIAGHVDLRESVPLDTRTDAVATVRLVETDLLGAHSTFLSHSLDAVIASTSGQVDASRACHHMLDALSAADQFQVLVTFAGIAGDGARYCPYSALLSSDDSRRQLWESETTLYRTLRRREVQRVARRPVVTHDPACMSYCMGLATDHLMPPFIGAFRNADGVFGATLFAIYPKALSVHLPVGILHDSHRTSEYPESQRMIYMEETRASDFLIRFIARVGNTMHAHGASHRLTRLAEAIIDFADSAVDDFANVLREVALSARCEELMRLDRLINEPLCPASVIHATHQYRDAFRKAVKDPDFFIPAEFKSAGSSALRNTQLSFRQFGNAMLAWPEICQKAAEFAPDSAA